MSVSSSVYETAAADWATGPEPVYTVLARRLLAAAPASLRGWRCLDVGAGTGACSRLLSERGAMTVEADLSEAMLRWKRKDRPPAVVADTCRLPFRDAVIDLAVAGFVLNHLSPVEPALAELARLLRRDGRLLASTWPHGTDPVKDTAEGVLRAHGWTPPPWHTAMRANTATTGDPQHMEMACAAAGLHAAVRIVSVDDGLPLEAILRWRSRLPQTAGWLASLDSTQRGRVREDLAAALSGVVQPRLRMLMVDARRMA